MPKLTEDQQEEYTKAKTLMAAMKDLFDQQDKEAIEKGLSEELKSLVTKARILVEEIENKMDIDVSNYDKNETQDDKKLNDILIGARDKAQEALSEIIETAMAEERAKNKE